MKKVDTEILEKMAKEKNIDKDKIEKIADGYKGKSEGELMDELVKIGKTLEGKEQVVSKLKAFLNDEQKKKLDAVMDKIYDAEVKDKIEHKKSKSKSTIHQMIQMHLLLIQKKLRKLSQQNMFNLHLMIVPMKQIHIRKQKKLLKR